MNSTAEKPNRADQVRRRRQQTTRRRDQAVRQQITSARPLISRPRRVEGARPILRRAAGRWHRFEIAIPGGGALAVPNFSLPRWAGTWRTASLMLVLLLGAMLVRLLSDRQMYVAAINLGGASLVPAQEIFADSGLAGQHVFWVNPAAAVERIQAIPGIASAQVEVAWPARVTVAVQERVPQVLLLEGGQKWWVDGQGQKFKARGDLPGLLLVETEGAQAVDSLPADALQGALQLKQLRGNIDKLYYQPNRGLSYQDGRGWRGYFGVGGQMAQKLAIYERLVADLQAQGITPREISVENLRAPVYKR